MFRRRLSLLALVLAGCSCLGPRTEKLSADAEAILSRAHQPGPGGSLVIDLEEARALGLIKPGDANVASVVADMAMYLLPGAAAELKDQPAGALAARTAVLLALARDWADWPKVLRIGLLIPAPLPGEEVEAVVGGTTLVLAVKASKVQNEELLAGIAALDRAGGEPMLRQGDDGLWCLAEKTTALPICLGTGDGYLALAGPEALRSLFPGAGSPRPASPAPALIRIRAEVPLVGTGTLALSGRKDLRVDVDLDLIDPKMAETLEKLSKDAIARLDQNRTETRTVIAPALEQTQKALAADAKAPDSLKGLAAKATLDSLLDPRGTFRSFRDSLQQKREGSRFTASAAFPEKAVRRFIDDTGVITGAAVAGAAALLVLPNVARLQCEAKQAEARNVLAALAKTQSARAGNWARTFADLPDFTPPESRQYTYCLGDACLDCTADGCAKVIPDENPCLQQRALAGDEASDAPPMLCAFGDPDRDLSLDVWLFDREEGAVNLQADCD